MIIIIIILSITVVVLGYTTFNLLKKNELQEEILLSYLEYLTKISGIIDFSAKKIEEIDSKETFKSDDEIGFFFEQVKQIQDILNQFRIQ
jgi:Na+-transporting NADH:ubiquinone oxidoreductase subunit NqrE